MKRICIIIVIIGFLFSGCVEEYDQDNEIQIIPTQSFFKDYKIINNTVYIYCKICIQNNTQESAHVKLLGFFSKDYETRLLKEEQIFASSEDNPNITSFSVLPGVSILDVVFRGSFGGFPQKQNRLLPEIQIIIE